MPERESIIHPATTQLLYKFTDLANDIIDYALTHLFKNLKHVLYYTVDQNELL